MSDRTLRREPNVGHSTVENLMSDRTLRREPNVGQDYTVENLMSDTLP